MLTETTEREVSIVENTYETPVRIGVSCPVTFVFTVTEAAVVLAPVLVITSAEELADALVDAPVPPLT